MALFSDRESAVAKFRQAREIVTALYRIFMDHNCLVRASSLSYTTVLSLVPVFALTFAVLKGLGVQNQVEPILLDEVAAGSREVISRIIAYINNTNMKTVGAIGVIGVIMTALGLLSSIEECFNAIWGVRENRKLLRKFSDYLSVFITGPLFLLTAFTMTTTLQSQWLVQWLVQRTFLGDFILSLFSLVPFFSVWIAFVFLYIFMPTTRVRLPSALLGGILAGTAWQTAQWGYVHFQVGVSRYNAIYGTLATLPIFMVWIYISWVIVLLGMEIVYFHQNRRSILEMLRRPAVSFATREVLALGLFAAVCRDFETGLPPASPGKLATELALHEGEVRELLGTLEEGGLAGRITGGAEGWHPLHPPEQIRVADVIRTLRRAGGPPPDREPALPEELRAFAERIDRGLVLSFADTTMLDISLPAPPG